MFWSTVGNIFAVYLFAVVGLGSMIGGVVLLFDVHNDKGWEAVGSTTAAVLLIILSLVYAYTTQLCMNGGC